MKETEDCFLKVKKDYFKLLHREKIFNKSISDKENYLKKFYIPKAWYRVEYMAKQDKIPPAAKRALKEAEERQEIIRAAEEDKAHPGLPAGWFADRVVRVTRPSPTAGLSIAYRLIVEGS